MATRLEPVMDKVLVATVLVLSLLAQPALAARGDPRSTTQKAKPAAEKKSRATIAGPTGTCRRYVAVIGAVVSVPC